MAEKATNKLIPILGIAIIVIVGALFMKSGDDKNVEMRTKQNVTAPDGDSTADTLRTLTAEVKALREENNALATKQAMMAEATPDGSADAESDSRISALASRVDELMSQSMLLGTPEPSDPSFDLNDTAFDFNPSAAPQDEWIEPANERPRNENGEYIPNIDMNGMSVPSIDSFDNGSALDNSVGQMLTGGVNDEDAHYDPVYTIPRNSTLIGSTGMTALLGRIPVNGSVEDPYPVKIIIGKDNLTANGLELSEVSHMIFTGTATGDWALSCVRADLTSATYVFEDGTIRTLSIGDESLQGGSANANRIAWLSDDRGIPCVSGRRISNAASQLTVAMIAEGIAAGAKAVANAETTNVTTPQGDNVSSVTGDALKNAGFETLAGGGSALTEWLKARQQQSFDVIYVDTGARVAVHIDAELQIDYNPNGRKLNHGFNKQARASRYLD